MALPRATASGTRPPSIQKAGAGLANGLLMDEEADVASRRCVGACNRFAGDFVSTTQQKRIEIVVYAIDIACIAFLSCVSQGASRDPDNISVFGASVQLQHLNRPSALPSQVRVFRLAISIPRVYTWDALWRMCFICSVYAIARFAYHASFHRLFNRSKRSQDRKFSTLVQRYAFGKPHD